MLLDFLQLLFLNDFLAALRWRWVCFGIGTFFLTTPLRLSFVGFMIIRHLRHCPRLGREEPDPTMTAARVLFAKKSAG